MATEIKVHLVLRKGKQILQSPVLQERQSGGGGGTVDVRDQSSLSVIISATRNTYQVHHRDSGSVGLGRGPETALTSCPGNCGKTFRNPSAEAWV